MEENFKGVGRWRRSCYNRNWIAYDCGRKRIWTSGRSQLFNIRYIALWDKIDLDIVDRDGRRLIQVRNPWSKGGILKSSFSTVELRDALSDDQNQKFGPDVSRGTFWIEYAMLSQTFKTLFLNWNPGIFQYCRRKHFSFTPNGSDFDIAANGQYTISVQGTGDVWILLERHYLGKSEGWEGYIGLAIFPGNERIYSYSRPRHRVHCNVFIQSDIDRIC